MPSNSTETTRSKQPTLAELDGQVNQIREDLAELTRMLGKGGSAKAEELTGQAKIAAQKLAERSQEAVATLNEEAGKLEAEVMLQIRKKPLTSIGIAAGVGFLAALLMRK